MTRRVLLNVALLSLLTSRADAATINLLLTININSPTSGEAYSSAPDVSFGYNFFTSTNAWPSSPSNAPSLTNPGGSLFPGVTQFPVSLNTESLDDFYLSGWGTYTSFGPGLPPPPFGFPTLYALTPIGFTQDSQVMTYGPPWIPLENLGPEGLSGGFRVINGYNRPGGIGTWTVALAATQPAPVPEPASMLLLGSGLAAIAARKFRQSKAPRQE
jgi:hypothetical protein